MRTRILISLAVLLLTAVAASSQVARSRSDEGSSTGTFALYKLTNGTGQLLRSRGVMRREDRFVGSAQRWDTTGLRNMQVIDTSLESRLG